MEAFANMISIKISEAGQIFIWALYKLQKWDHQLFFHLKANNVYIIATIKEQIWDKISIFGILDQTHM